MSFKLYNQFYCSSMMLPEHREALAKHKKETAEKHKAPCIDEHQFELWERLVQWSCRERKQILIKTIYKNKICEIKGVLLEVAPDNGLLRLLTKTGEKKVEAGGIISISQPADLTG